MRHQKILRERQASKLDCKAIGRDVEQVSGERGARMPNIWRSVRVLFTKGDSTCNIAPKAAVKESLQPICIYTSTQLFVFLGSFELQLLLGYIKSENQKEDLKRENPSL